MDISRRRWLAAAAGAPWALPAFAEQGSQHRAWPRQRATPSLQLPALDGTTWSLAAARGKPVLLNWWASWCEPCRAEMPSLQQLAAQHQGQGLQVMAVNFKEGEHAVRKFLGATGLSLPVLYDRDGAAAKSFGVRIFPSTVGIDRQGRARFVVTGEVDWAGADARRWVAALL
ncbi:TlpA family protein disulfide reductase [Ramlibacter algicola]|uniref:TlpA family protein disulfide reductase n=1 Tax=Ramlibacter algicola TaxID=2795217 RepID=A0A934UPR2_9BURK|nr:TlpA disulfide reductase family protein [Ramlibacter algicola]MBK0391360.1 TlpA family protein disulfide reductase [Ramlibacter algicola]